MVHITSSSALRRPGLDFILTLALSWSTAAATDHAWLGDHIVPALTSWVSGLHGDKASPAPPATAGWDDKGRALVTDTLPRLMERVHRKTRAFPGSSTGRAPDC